MATDKNGKAVKVGDLIHVLARVESVSGSKADGNIGALTEVKRGAGRIQYDLPLLHGSDVEVVED
jgi:hypothetical protein